MLRDLWQAPCSPDSLARDLCESEGPADFPATPAPPSLSNSLPQVAQFPAIIRLLKQSVREPLSPNWTSKQAPLGQVVIVADDAIMPHSLKGLKKLQEERVSVHSFLNTSGFWNAPGLLVCYSHGFCRGSNMQDLAPYFNGPHHLFITHLFNT